MRKIKDLISLFAFKSIDSNSSPIKFIRLYRGEGNRRFYLLINCKNLSIGMRITSENGIWTYL